jgi:hypothetical protein
MPRRENRNIRHKNEILSKRIRSLCGGTSDLSNDTKKRTTKSRETTGIPLSKSSGLQRQKPPPPNIAVQGMVN